MARSRLSTHSPEKPAGQLVARLTKSRESFTFRPIAFDEARDWVFMGSQDGRIYGWTAQTGRLMTRSEPQSSYVDTLLVLRNGWVAYSGFGKDIRLWNPDSGDARVLTSARPTSNLVCDPDGTTLLFGVADHSIEFWDTGSGQLRRTLKLPD
jgi:WD40 repeat protein